jgi:2-polyprenyl-3-methyl-5-hydroxy-6-metoxy-1,4-benzoquinol methylase
MDSQTFRKKLAEKIGYYFSYRNNLRRLAHALDTHSLQFFPDNYVERPEGGPTNIESKLLRQTIGGPFEPYSVSLINRAAVQLVGEPATILEAGCGTGMFASFLASQNSKVRITASEFDEKTLAWAREHRSAPNISYVRLTFEECSVDQFDLVVALEVIEHLFDYAGFLRAFSRLAPKAIISTPNKRRDPFSSIANTPAYSEHVREWTAGEFFWVLRCYYDDVELYTLPNFKDQVRRYTADSAFVPTVKKCSVLEKEEPLIAKCGSPRRG